MVDLDALRALQQLAYRAAEETAAELRPGITEREAALNLRRRLEGEGIDDWFHTPFVWFGRRTTLPFRFPHQFLPTGGELEEGMAFILDCAPARGGLASDIGYSGSLGDNPIVEQLQGDLAEHRVLILDLVRARTPLRDIYQAVDRLASRQGLECRHTAYPGHVLAHRIDPVKPGGSRVLVTFGDRHLRALGRAAAREVRHGTSPLWNGSRRSNHPATPGLWAVEPHLAFRGVGAKFEELLVVTDDGDALWLDDDLPHVRRHLARTAEGVRS